MSEVAFPYAGPAVLAAYERLESPLAVLSFGSRTLIWANPTAIAFWGAQSLDDLQRKAASFGSAAVESLLGAALSAVRQGKRWQQPGPLYPSLVRLSCTGIGLDGHPEALLVEIWRDTSSIESPTKLAMPVARGWAMAKQDRKAPPAAASQEMLDRLIDLAAMPALLLAARGKKLLKANSAAAALLQVAAGNASAADTLFVSTEARTHFLDEVANNGQCTGSAQLMGRGGQPFAAVISGRMLQVGKNNIILLMAHDIDDLHKVSVELETALGLQRTVSHRQRLMLEIAAHEFRTPLAVIDGAAQRIARHATGSAPEQIVAMTDRIRTSVTRLGRLLENTVERARDNRTGIECRPTPGQLQSVIAQTAALFGQRADIQIDDAVAQLPETWFDRVLMEQVFVNLVENAIKYSSGRPRVRFSAVAGKDCVEVLVRDWGIGILPEERERVFGESTRGINVGLRAGSGLGLYIVKAIIHAHGGEISVAQTRGEGTTMKIELPIRWAATQSVELRSGQA